MYVITYKNRPITLERLYALDNDVVNDHNEDEMFLTAPSLAKVKALYIHYRGFTWRERNKGIEAKKVRV